jgi:TonB family protein
MIAICMSLSVLSMLLCSGKHFLPCPDVELKDPLSNWRHIELDDAVVMQDPIEVLPTVKYRPEIRTPDSLRAVRELVKVWVQIELDSTGIPKRCRILKSSNSRFNRTALNLAHKHRFEVRESLSAYGSKGVRVAIPIVFNRKQ